MRVVYIFPIAANHKNIPDILKQLESVIMPELVSLGVTEKEIKFASTDYTYVPPNISLIPTPKGKGILDCLKNTIISPNIVIMCDGSGKIPYKYIVPLFQELISDPNVHCVMAERKNNKAISGSRYLIERFEIFALKQYHESKQEIPDGQCGLWAFRCGKLKVDDQELEIKLTAEGYEIELDLLGEVLENNLNLSFIPIELPEVPSKSLFTYQNNIDKMVFLMKKYRRLKDCIVEYFQEFEQTKEFEGLCKNRDEWGKYKESLMAVVQKEM